MSQDVSDEQLHAWVDRLADAEVREVLNYMILLNPETVHQALKVVQRARGTIGLPPPTTTSGLVPLSQPLTPLPETAPVSIVDTVPTPAPAVVDDDTDQHHVQDATPPVSSQTPHHIPEPPVEDLGSPEPSRRSSKEMSSQQSHGSSRRRRTSKSKAFKLFILCSKKPGSKKQAQDQDRSMMVCKKAGLLPKIILKERDTDFAGDLMDISLLREFPQFFFQSTEPDSTPYFLGSFDTVHEMYRNRQFNEDALYDKLRPAATPVTSTAVPTTTSTPSALDTPLADNTSQIPKEVSHPSPAIPNPNRLDNLFRQTSDFMSKNNKQPLADYEESSDDSTTMHSARVAAQNGSTSDLKNDPPKPESSDSASMDSGKEFNTTPPVVDEVQREQDIASGIPEFLAGMNQPKEVVEDDDMSLGDDPQAIFDPPKAISATPLLDAAKRAAAQMQGSGQALQSPPPTQPVSSTPAPVQPPTQPQAQTPAGPSTTVQPPTQPQTQPPTDPVMNQTVGLNKTTVQPMPESKPVSAPEPNVSGNVKAGIGFQNETVTLKPVASSQAMPTPTSNGSQSQPTAPPPAPETNTNVRGNIGFQNETVVLKPAGSRQLQQLVTRAANVQNVTPQPKSTSQNTPPSYNQQAEPQAMTPAPQPPTPTSQMDHVTNATNPNPPAAPSVPDTGGATSWMDNAASAPPVASPTPVPTTSVAPPSTSSWVENAASSASPPHPASTTAANSAPGPTFSASTPETNSVSQRQLEKKKSMERKFPERGCYLVYDAVRAELNIYFSEIPIVGAVGVWTCSHMLEFQQAQGFGKSELIGNCAEGVQDRQRYFEGWCQFVKAAKSMEATLTVLDVGVPVDFYLYDNGATVKVTGDEFETTEVDAVACVPRGAEFPMGLKGKKWSKAAKKIGAVALFRALSNKDGEPSYQEGSFSQLDAGAPPTIPEEDGMPSPQPTRQKVPQSQPLAEPSTQQQMSPAPTAPMTATPSQPVAELQQVQYAPQRAPAPPQVMQPPQPMMQQPQQYEYQNASQLAPVQPQPEQTQFAQAPGTPQAMMQPQQYQYGTPQAPVPQQMAQAPQTMMQPQQNQYGAPPVQMQPQMAQAQQQYASPQNSMTQQPVAMEPPVSAPVAQPPPAMETTPVNETPTMNAVGGYPSSAEAPIPPGGACYLLYEPGSSGRLVEQYSQTPVPDAIGRWVPAGNKKIAGFKFKQNLGKNVLIGNCAAGVQGRKNYSSGWCQFVRSARVMEGEVMLWDPMGKGLMVDVYVYQNDSRPAHQTIRLQQGVSVNVEKILAVACIPKNTPFFEGMGVDILKWLADGGNYGASSRF
eukprot:Nitzschia sp. Nitz4//scaffold269_size25945//16367//20314//NITZ4_008291-RA/size25945-processed-gene-0.15-mRNA-1//-1//CDS//3329544973//7741//frame0